MGRNCLLLDACFPKTSRVMFHYIPSLKLAFVHYTPANKVWGIYKNRLPRLSVCAIVSSPHPSFGGVLEYIFSNKDYL